MENPTLSAEQNSGVSGQVPRSESVAAIFKTLDGPAALLAAESTTMGKVQGERDTEFVKRIVANYLFAKAELDAVKAAEFELRGL